jgi:hypothetical protein
MKTRRRIWEPAAGTLKEDPMDEIKVPTTPAASCPQSLGELLTDPAMADLSNRELAKRCDLNAHYVAGYRAAGAAGACVTPSNGQSPPLGCDTPPAARSPHTQSLPGRTLALEPPALNSLDCWALATPQERMKFVSAVGLNNLIAVAPARERDFVLMRPMGAAS